MAKIREHSPPVAGWCIHCHQRQSDGLWPAACVERKDWLKPAKGSAPRERVVACEDPTIMGRMADIRGEAEPRCPQTPSRRLYECLRSSAPCTDLCPLKHDWIGPQKD